MKAALKNVVRKMFGAIGYEIHRLSKENPAAPLRLWEQDQAYWTMLANLSVYSLVDEKRLYIIYQLAHQAMRLGGEVAEVGVYRGASAKVMATVFRQCARPMHIFDTFTGMPPVAAGIDAHHEGDFADTSLESVQALLAPFPDVHIYKGLFPQTAGPIQTKRFCFVHVDVDIYPSAKACCEFFYPRLEGGAFMVFDDYGFNSCPGVRKAVDEFFVDKPERPCYLPTGQAIVIRLPG